MRSAGPGNMPRAAAFRQISGATIHVDLPSGSPKNGLSVDFSKNNYCLNAPDDGGSSGVGDDPRAGDEPAGKAKRPRQRGTRGGRGRTKAKGPAPSAASAGAPAPAKGRSRSAAGTVAGPRTRRKPPAKPSAIPAEAAPTSFEA